MCCSFFWFQDQNSFVFIKAQNTNNKYEQRIYLIKWNACDSFRFSSSSSFVILLIRLNDMSPISEHSFVKSPDDNVTHESRCLFLENLKISAEKMRFHKEQTFRIHTHTHNQFHAYISLAAFISVLFGLVAFYICCFLFMNKNGKTEEKMERKQPSHRTNGLKEWILDHFDLLNEVENIFC